jgi:hypothetical protein
MAQKPLLRVEVGAPALARTTGTKLDGLEASSLQPLFE